MSSFHAANYTLVVLLALFLLWMSTTGVAMAFNNVKEKLAKSGYFTVAMLMEISANPVIILVGMVLLVITNAVIFSKGKGRAMTKSSYGWGALALVSLAVVAAMMSAIMTPLIDYMNTDVKELKTLGRVFQSMTVARLVVSCLFIVAACMFLSHSTKSTAAASSGSSRSTTVPTSPMSV